MILIGLGLVLTGYGCLAREGRQPAWHHHLARPVLASLTMIPVCLALKHFHVLLAVLGGAITYAAFWVALGACVTRNSGGESWGRWLELEFVIESWQTASLINRDMEVAHEIRHDHDVLRGAQLRR